MIRLPSQLNIWITSINHEKNKFSANNVVR